MDGHLYRSRDDRMLAGVAGGLAELWDADPSVVRIVWALIILLTGGLAFLLYIVMALVVPEEPELTVDPASGAAQTTAATSALSPTDRTTARAERRAARAARRAERRARGESSAPLIIGGVLVVVGAIFLVREFLPQLDAEWVWPMLLIGTGVVILVAAFGQRHAPASPSAAEMHQDGPPA